ncbi:MULTISPECIES: hypothetical protein [Paenibacillus]|uniref:hypothetical protein n=1 Tax=Paenibacillus TaxID=44249 RepID=UPI002FDF8F87
MKPYMDREAAIDDFLEKHVIGRWEEDIPLISQVYEQKRTDIEAGLLKVADEVCRKAALLQGQQLKGDIQYLYFTFLRTSLLERKACYRIDVYDHRWYLDRVECSARWEADFIFDPLFRRMTELESVRREYARKISVMDVDRILQIVAVYYHSFAVEFIRTMVADLLQSDGFGVMRKRPDFLVLAGEYQDQSEVLFGPLEPDHDSDRSEAGGM